MFEFGAIRNGFANFTERSNGKATSTRCAAPTEHSDPRRHLGWIDFFAARDTPEVAALSRLIGEDEIALGDLVTVEVLWGFRDGPQLRLASSIFAPLRHVSLCGHAIAETAAANYRALRRAGVTVRGTIDVVIATWCIENRVALLHNDRDFIPMEKTLGLVGWR